MKSEFIMMRLAGLAGLNVAPVQLQSVLNKDILLIERFDRYRAATGGWASQGMLIMGQANQSQIALCLEAAHLFLLDRGAARSIVLAQLETVRQHWSAVCDEANISVVDRNVLATRQMLNPFVFEQLPEADRDIAQRADEIRPGLAAATLGSFDAKH